MAGGSASDEGVSPDVTVVLATAGDVAVGKTCLLVRFGEGHFAEGAQPTIGVDSLRVSRRVLGKPCSFCAFDTSGDEKYHSVTRSFYRGRDAVVLVYDATDVSTLESLRDFWLPTVLSVCNPETVVAVAAAKSDTCPEGPSEREAALLQSLSDALSSRLSPLLQARTSAKSGDGVEEFFAKIAQEVIRVREETGGEGYGKPPPGTVDLRTAKRGAPEKNSCPCG